MIEQDIIDAAKLLSEGGYLTQTLHGNISARVPDSGDLILTKRSYLSPTMTVNDLTRVSLSGDSPKDLHPSSAEIVEMHRIAYNSREDIGAVIHTHSPNATAFAVTSREIPCSYEAMVRHGILEPIPVARYGPRGSDVSVRNIQRVLGNAPAILLENHGLLVFGGDVNEAVKRVVVIEEAAMIFVKARALGEITPIPQKLVGLTKERREQFMYED